MNFAILDTSVSAFAMVCSTFWIIPASKTSFWGSYLAKVLTSTINFLRALKAKVVSEPIFLMIMRAFATSSTT